ncbi:ADP-ribosylglycohydrolase family protein [Chamaesiphon sp. VAR_48_metabat_135_sub]|uniref:ADP-ribosylglycohydrolase family protein n=1 Tax=Chamaesiphon sp. VAR_48_metabat_135_sub TaxID=2964699 RepID=UPI00286D4898|nr:ADP-ribosylglycohydrolase family protein [Chamaesiphon sp. VAR_48_metabat_135_sub]
MKHLLLTRFQGALIGANTIYITPHQINPNQLIMETSPALIDGMTSLIRSGRVEPQDWEQNIFIDTPSPERAIVAMLPLMLFFHDDRVKLRETLITVSHSWQLDWETCSSAVAIGYIISRSLTESFNPRTIISQLLDEMLNLHPLLFQELSTIDRLLAQSSSLHQVTQRLTTTPHPIIASTVLAIYCLLSTPEDFSLATRRAYQIEDRSQLTCALTGILAGAQNSLTGIPLNGYIATQEREQWLLAAESLLTSWAGVYHEHSASQSIALLPASFQPTVAYPLSVAAPQVIQQRH